MPVNFEIDFIQPLLLDLQNGKFADVEDYAKAVTKYYQQTIAKGTPIGIPPTLPSPAASGAPVPVSAGPGDGYIPTISNVSSLRMERIVAGYYKAKDISINKATLDFYKKSLERLINDAKKQRDKVQALVPLIAKLREDVSQLPSKLDDLVQGLKVILSSYKSDLNTIVESSTPTQNQDELQQTLKQSYKEESELADSILNTNLTDLKQAANLSVKLQRYLRSQQNNSNTQDLFRSRFNGLVTNLTKDLSNANQPEGFADVLVRFKQNKTDLKQAERQTIQKAEQAVESIKVIKYYVEPEIVKLERELELSKKNVEDRFRRKIDSQKRVINQKAQQLFAKKQESEKVKLFKKYKDDTQRLADENKQKVNKYISQTKDANKIIQQSIGLVKSVNLIRTDTIKQVDVLKSKVQALEPGTATNNKVELKNYLNKQGLSEFRKALEPLAESSTTNFINIRNILQSTDTEFSKSVNRLNSLQEDYEELQDRFSSLQQGTSIKTKRKRIRVKPPQSILAALILIKRLTQRIESLIEKCATWIKEQINKKRKDIEKIQERIRIAVIKSIPSSNRKESIETKQQALEEQKRLIELYNSRVESILKKTKALTRASRSVARLASNTATSDFTVESNEQPLKSLSKAVFDFNTVGVDSKSTKYTSQVTIRNNFNKGIDRFKKLQQLTALAKFALEGLDLNFVDRFDAELEKLRLQKPELYKTNYKQIPTILKTFIQSPANDPKKLTQTIKEINTLTKKQTLSKFIGSANIITILVSLEREYLQKTRKHLNQLVSLSEASNNEKTSTELKKLQATLEGQGSFIITLIDTITQASRDLKVFIQKEVRELFEPIERRLQKEQTKLEEWYTQRVKSLVKKKTTNDLAPQSIMYNIATTAFWVGATWTNSVGTTFVTNAIGPFKPLIIDAKSAGIEASVRELASNLQLQLLQVQGLVVPNPTTGITPFPFVGYK